MSAALAFSSNTAAAELRTWADEVAAAWLGRNRPPRRPPTLNRSIPARARNLGDELSTTAPGQTPSLESDFEGALPAIFGEMCSPSSLVHGSTCRGSHEGLPSTCTILASNSPSLGVNPPRRSQD